MIRNARFASRVAWATAAGLFVVGAALILSASSAGAARVVDVRVGKHAEFTRVVFELDAPAGYRIERGGMDDRELVVLMDAQGNGKRIGAKQALIESVELEPQGFRSIGRIQLAGRELRLKEMILANPPRIVLDVMRPEDRPIVRLPAAQPAKVAAAKTPAKTQGATTRTQAPKLAEPKAPEPAMRVAQVEAAPPTPAKRAPATQKAVTAGIPKPLVEADPRLKQIVLDGIEVAEVEEVEEVVAEEKATGSDEGFLGIAPPPKPDRPTLATNQAPGASSGQGSAPPLAVARTRQAPTPAAPEAGGFDLTTAGIAGGGLLLLLGGLFIWRKRRAASPEPIDFDDYGDAPDENPFEVEGTDVVETVEEASAPEALMAEGEDAPVADAGTAQEVEPMGDLFAGFDSDTEEVPADVPVTEPSFQDNTATAIQEPTTATQEGTNMDVQTNDSASTRVMDMPTGPMTGGAPQADQSELVRELERRVLSLETRLEEMIEGRERLEKQMAAQTEELRVQRAAIARTQRAVRNMNRPEEDAPTEPALRDPNRPEGARSE